MADLATRPILPLGTPNKKRWRYRNGLPWPPPSSAYAQVMADARPLRAAGHPRVLLPLAAQEPVHSRGTAAAKRRIIRTHPADSSRPVEARKEGVLPGAAG